MGVAKKILVPKDTELWHVLDPTYTRIYKINHTID